MHPLKQVLRLFDQATIDESIEIPVVQLSPKLKFHEFP